MRHIYTVIMNTLNVKPQCGSFELAQKGSDWNSRRQRKS